MKFRRSLLLTALSLLQSIAWGWERDEHVSLLGDPCFSSEACQLGVPESQCTSGLCTCPPYHVAYNATACLRTSLLGFECLVDAQCSVRIHGGRCIDGLCQCDVNLVPHRRHLCLPPALPGDKCYSTEQCLSGDKNSYCKYIVPKVHGRCICHSNTQHVGKMCLKTQSSHEMEVKQVSLGLPCTSWAQCQAADPNAACIHGVCACTVGEPICEGETPGCFNKTFQCRSSGHCISPSFVCNGIRDCPDGSDEECNTMTCPPQSFRCHKGQPACISPSWVCDGKSHCSDGSDEQYCHLHPESGEVDSECPGNGFKCRNGTCLPQHVFCNGVIDCEAAEDEPDKACKQEFQTVEQCPFRCSNGRCRSSDILCTGVNGCGDNSDEALCHACRCPAISQWRTRDPNL